MVAKSYGGVLGSKKYPVELLIKEDGGPTVEDLANFAAQVAEVPRGSQRLIFKGKFFLLDLPITPYIYYAHVFSTLFMLIKIIGLQPHDSTVMLSDRIIEFA